LRNDSVPILLKREKVRILIVDDNQELASAIQIMLEDEGYEVRLANEGQDG